MRRGETQNGNTRNTSGRSAAMALMLSAGVMANAAWAGGTNTYLFNTNTGNVTFNGAPVTAFEGVGIFNAGLAGSIRTWRINGNMTIPEFTTVRFEGASPARVLVGGNLSLPINSTIDAGAIGAVPGPGGGAPGAGGAGGSGGSGGRGGGGPTSPLIPFTNGQNGAAGDGTTLGWIKRFVTDHRA